MYVCLSEELNKDYAAGRGLDLRPPRFVTRSTSYPHQRQHAWTPPNMLDFKERETALCTSSLDAVILAGRQRGNRCQHPVSPCVYTKYMEVPTTKMMT
jgi:hypothetical protein